MLSGTNVAGGQHTMDNNTLEGNDVALCPVAQLDGEVNRLAVRRRAFRRPVGRRQG